MDWQFTVWVPPLLLAGLVTFALAVRAVDYYRRYRERTYLLAFSATMLSIAVWEFTIVAIEVTPNATLKLLGYNFLTALVVPLGLYTTLWFGLSYARYDDWLDYRATVPVALHVGGATIAVALEPTLFFSGGLVTIPQQTVLGLTFDPYLALDRDLTETYQLFQLYSYAIVTATLAVLIHFLVRQRDHVYLGQAVALSIGIVTPTAANTLLLTGFVPTVYHTTEITLLVSAIALSVAIFRYRLLDLVPIARDAVVDDMRDGYIVCNDSGDVVDYNDMAVELLGDTDRDVVGSSLQSLLPDGGHLPQDTTGTADIVVESGDDSDRRDLEATVSSLGDNGKVITLRDITERRAYERSLEDKNEKLQLLNQIVRHDIGNDVTVIDGHLSLLSEHVDDPGRDHLETIDDHTAHIQELTSVLRDLVQTTLRDDEDLKPIPLAQTLEAEIAEVGGAFPAATVEIEGHVPSVNVTANEMLSSVFTNLLKNAVQHNDKQSPEVTVSAECDADTVTVSVADNGPGIQPADRETVFGQGEKGLESSGSGIGLHLVKTLVSDFGGDVWITDNDPEGAVFTVELDRASPE